jgi:hypothetical protein
MRLEIEDARQIGHRPAEAGHDRRDVDVISVLIPVVIAVVSGFSRTRTSEISRREPQRPPDRLLRPRRNAVGHVEEGPRPLAQAQRFAVHVDGALVGRQHAGQAFEQRRLAGAVRTDQAENLAGADRERHAGERGDTPVPLGQVRDVDHDRSMYRQRASYYQPT